MFNIVRNFDSKQSRDCNGICIVKNITSCIIQPLTLICNKSFSDGVCPESMKIAKITPIYKSGNEELFTKYRPVPLLLHFSKILEKLFNEKLQSFMIYIYGAIGSNRRPPQH